MDNCFLQFLSNLVACLVLLSLQVSGNSNESELECITSIKVPRNKLVEALVMTEFKINCTVNVLKCQGIPKISWCKLYGEDCKASNQSNYKETVDWKNFTYGTAFLTFLNISMEDAGLYRCKSQNSVSHSINVTVTADRVDSDSGNQNNTILDNTKGEGSHSLLPYVYICGGVIGLVVIVIAVSLFIIKCQGKGSTRNVMTNTNQCIETQRRDLITTSHPHHNTHPPSARLTTAVSYANDTPVRAGSHSDRTSAGRVSANTIESKGCRKNVRTQEEEDNPLVYASLNHQAMSRGPKRSVQQETEPSEYAAIRFR
nr:B- and T-lymphocyte attenuator-like isoform X1 [Misgurnus anguillicaudatus]